MFDIDPGQILLQYACLLFSLCFHEAAHAFMADRCGDPSARLMGRISMNPLAHIDPIGTVVMPLLMFVTHIPYLIGWAKPVPFNPRNLRDIRLDPVKIALAGPVSNLLLAVIGMVLLRGAVLVMGPDHILDSNIILDIAFTFIMMNIVLMVFNLLPIPPLDGHYVLHYFLPAGGQRVLEQIGPFGIIIVLVLVQKSGIIGVPVEYLLIGVQRFVFWV
ncbi:MAG: site-2 protease family protein [Candidatus Hydrogenedentes bacterium]|nr:site-2 protease family protein [Candidatus Hydrogenedentota bacterium]